MVLTVKLAPYSDTLDLVVKFLDLVTVTVPPGLPISMTFGIVYAMEKMKKKKIFCISPNKTILGGMTNLICFDKTGTLTEDFMDFNLLIPVGRDEMEGENKICFKTPIKNNQQLSIEETIKKNKE